MADCGCQGVLGNRIRCSNVVVLKIGLGLGFLIGLGCFAKIVGKAASC